MEPIKGFNIRLPLDLYRWLKARAATNERSLNKEVIMILRQVKAGGRVSDIPEQYKDF